MARSSHDDGDATWRPPQIPDFAPADDSAMLVVILATALGRRFHRKRTPWVISEYYLGELASVNKRSDVQWDGTVDFSCRANLVRGRRAVGGRLFVMNRSLVFCPSRLEQLFGATSPGVLPLEGATVEVLRSTIAQPLAGSLRRRLRVGTAEWALTFVVSNPERVASVIDEVLDREGGPPA